MSIFKGIAVFRKHAAKSLATPLTRQHASVAKLVDIVEFDNTGFATVSMNSRPVNSLNMELLMELTHSLRELEKSKCRGIILTSSLLTVFSAGLDILELYKKDSKHVHIFWRAVQEVWSTLYGTGLPTAAAINGACVGRGCILALSCEYRVFVEGKHKMGLNEAMVGLFAPQYAQDAMMNTIGHRQTEISLLRGSLFTPEDALKIGLVDELASNKGDAIVKCENYLTSCADVSSMARSATKLQLRRKALRRFEKNQDLDAKKFIDYLEQPQVQMALEVYMEALKKRSQSKN